MTIRSDGPLTPWCGVWQCHTDTHAVGCCILASNPQQRHCQTTTTKTKTKTKMKAKTSRRSEPKKRAEEASQRSEPKKQAKDAAYYTTRLF